MIINAIGSNIVPKNRMKTKTSKMNSLPADLSSYNSQKFEKSMARDTFVSSSNAMQNNKKAKDVSFAGCYVDEKLVAESKVSVFVGTSSYMSQVPAKIYQTSYKPYCWETQEEIKKIVDDNSGITYSKESGLQGLESCSGERISCYVRFFHTSNHTQVPAFNREESLKQDIEHIKEYKNSWDYQKHLDNIRQLEEDEKFYRNQGDYNKERSEEESTKFFDFLSGKSLSYALDAEHFYLRAEEAKTKKETAENELNAMQNNAEDKIKWLQGEVDALAEARRSGSLVDISVRNIDNPDLPLEDFLKKEYKLANDETKTYNTDWVDKKIIALPNATVGVADAILMALGVSKAAAIAMSSAQKKFMITPLIKDSGFADKVLDGMKKVL